MGASLRDFQRFLQCFVFVRRAGEHLVAAWSIDAVFIALRLRRLGRGKCLLGLEPIRLQVIEDQLQVLLQLLRVDLYGAEKWLVVRLAEAEGVLAQPGRLIEDHIVLVGIISSVAEAETFLRFLALREGWVLALRPCQRSLHRPEILPHHLKIPGQQDEEYKR